MRGRGRQERARSGGGEMLKGAVEAVVEKERELCKILRECGEPGWVRNKWGPLPCGEALGFPFHSKPFPHPYGPICCSCALTTLKLSQDLTQTPH